VQQAIQGLSELLQRRRKLVVVAWAAALVLATPFAARETSRLTGGGFEDPHAQSTAVAHVVARDFPSVGNAHLSIVLVPRASAPPRSLHQAVLDVGRRIASVHEVSIAPEEREAALIGARLKSHRTMVVPLSFAGSEERAIDVAKKLRARLGIATHAGSAAGGAVEVHLVGQGATWAAFQQQSSTDSATAEARAFPVIAVVLLFAFASVAAMVLPLGLGIAAVTITGLLIYALSQITTMSVYVTSMASLIGIGVAVDYSLFVLARYREEIAAGQAPSDALSTAMSTSGVAVIFSGMTVVASLLSVFVIDSTAMRSIAAGAIIVVAVSALAAATLLPALIALLGERVGRPGRLAGVLRRLVRRDAPRGESAGEPVLGGRAEHASRKPGFWERWTGIVMRHPGTAIVAGVAVLLLLAAPALNMRVANFALDQLPPQAEIRQGTNAVAQLLGPGAVGPTNVLVNFDAGKASDPANKRILERVVGTLRANRSVSYVLPALISPSARAAELTTVLKVDPESSSARRAVERLRGSLPAAVAGAEIKLGGTTAVLVDFDRLVISSLWKVALLLLVMSFVALLFLLRSIVLPVKAVLMTMLSVAAAYGTLVMAFQWGWLGFLGLRKVPTIESIMLPLVLVVTFGLSMDYEIFLLTRIRERYLRTGDNRRAVAEGLSTSARTITSVALIMITVCLAFLGAGIGAVQRLGLAVAVALVVDATIVRLIIIPAAMVLLGKWNWWLPAWLDRLLPVAHADAPPIKLRIPDAPVSEGHVAP
jgi:RND superfamily putative drug exporter